MRLISEAPNFKKYPQTLSPICPELSSINQWNRLSGILTELHTSKRYWVSYWLMGGKTESTWLRTMDQVHPVLPCWATWSWTHWDPVIVARWSRSCVLNLSRWYAYELAVVVLSSWCGPSVNWTSQCCAHRAENPIPHQAWLIHFLLVWPNVQPGALQNRVFDRARSRCDTVFTFHQSNAITHFFPTVLKMFRAVSNQRSRDMRIKE